MKVFIALVSLLVIYGCSTLPQTFTSQNIMKIQQGMKSEEILKMFGEPKSIDQGICGKGEGRWTCTTWKYGEFLEQNASFTFSGDSGSYLLNNFTINNGCSAKQEAFATQNVMKIKQGMKSDEILKIFGEPKKISQAVCGGATGNTWTCTTWEYCSSSDKASFTFSGKAGEFLLNNFSVKR